MNRDEVRDLAAAAACTLLVVAAVLVGRHIEGTDHTLFANWPPLLASWGPHVGPGTPAALAVAVAAVAYGPALAIRLPWRTLLWVSFASSLAWTWSLALVDGWQRGVAHRLGSRYEYLRAVGRFSDIPAALRGFDQHILLGTPAPWPAHVAGHPPASTLTFVLLDRAGLGGGGWAGVWCVTVGATTCAAVLVAVRTLASEALARRAAPFLVLAPGAVWAGTSADGYFAAVAAWSVALLACAVTGRHAPAAAVGSGLMFGLTCYLSYGLTLFAVVAAGVLLSGTARGRSLARLSGLFLCGFTVVPLLFTAAGFDWWQAFRLLGTRYDQGVGGVRPYGYWVWANLACAVLTAGPAVAPALVRTVRELGSGLRPSPSRGRTAHAWKPLPQVFTRVHQVAPARASAALVVPMPGAGRDAEPAARDADLGAPVATRQAPPVTPQVTPPGPSAAPGRPRHPAGRLAVLVLCAALAMLAADLSGMSKAETERIWLPFVAWLLPACALLPRPRAWLVAQAGVALLVNHLLLTGW